MLSRATTPMLPKFLLLVAATARGAGVSIVVRNLAGEDVVVSWLQPGREPRGRVPQQEKPLKNATTMSINSYETHDSCAASCASADDRAAAAATERSAVFAVSDSPETISVVRTARRARVVAERAGPALDAAEAVDAALAACGAGGAEACANPDEAPGCAAAYLARWLARAAPSSSELERGLFSASYDRVPAPLPDPAHEKAEPEDLARVHATYAAGARPVDVRAACGAESDFEACARRVAKAAAVAIAQGTAEAQKATRRRSLEKRNASCAAHAGNSETVGTVEWTWAGAGDASATWGATPARGARTGPERARTVRHLFKPPAEPAALIAVVDDFVDDDECAAIMASAKPRLTRATHAHEGDLSHVSKARDSQQATVRPARGATDRDLDDPIARVKARSVGLANFLSNYSLGLDGQEELMAVQYNPGQQYMLHCDGSCDGSPFVAGGRLATVLMYCAAADGGGTAFPNANVHVVPAKGQAVYFHFRGPEPDGVVEDWHTEHSGCPVRSGEKWVVTQWLRDGVSKEFPHHRFDPSGGPIG
ncbi:procollagen-proline 4-dioxygenase [Aureococcus anophagefferens]|uniref:Procollagen-proline 4-dioxygenase n=1 Tax=Aureococcus anophagefferens TaxID=44056 RepID=A0ABR1FGL9_AURAN